MFSKIGGLNLKKCGKLTKSEFQYLLWKVICVFYLAMESLRSLQVPLTSARMQEGQFWKMSKMGLLRAVFEKIRWETEIFHKIRNDQREKLC